MLCPRPSCGRPRSSPSIGHRTRRDVLSPPPRPPYPVVLSPIRLHRSLYTPLLPLLLVPFPLLPTYAILLRTYQVHRKSSTSDFVLIILVSRSHHPPCPSWCQQHSTAQQGSSPTHPLLSSSLPLSVVCCGVRRGRRPGFSPPLFARCIMSEDRISITTTAAVLSFLGTLFSLSFSRAGLHYHHQVRGNVLSRWVLLLRIYLIYRSPVK